MPKPKRRGKEDKEGKATLVQQVDSIAAQLHAATAAIDRLHRQWRLYLLGLSFVVLSLSFYQLSQRLSRCYHHVKLVDSSVNDWTLFILYAAATGTDNIPFAVHILLDSGSHLCGCLMTVLLTGYLLDFRGRNLLLAHPMLLTSTLTVIPLLALYRLATQQETERDGLATCLVSSEHHAVLRNTNGDESVVGVASAFPVAVVFQGVAWVSLLFMYYQRAKHQYHIQEMEKARLRLGGGKMKKVKKQQ